MEVLPPPVTPDKSPASAIVYSLEEHIPLGPAVLVGVQHVSAMVVGTITPPLILSGVLKFSQADTAYLVSIALLASAFGTWLQCRQRGPVGSGLLSVTGTSFAFLQPLTQAGQAGGLALMLGLSCVTAPLLIVLAPFISRLRKVFTPLVSGVVVLLIGTSLIPTAFYGLAAPLRPDAPPWLGLMVGGVVIAVIVGAQATGRAWARIAGAALGVLAGCIVCGLAGGLHAPEPGAGGWFTRPQLLPHGFAFDWKFVPPFAFIYLVSLLEAMGDIAATSQLSGLPTEGEAHWRRLSGGVLADGITSTVAALFGGFPSATYAQNNGVIQITGVASRRVGYVMAVILALLGLFPAVGRWVTVLPPPVLGGLALLMFGLVAVAGVRLLLTAGLGQREGVIVAVSLGMGLGLPTQPGLLASLPGWLQALLESGISAGGLTALLLTLVWPAKIAAAD
ncbi:solute carrier family 23 protein [Opitutus sp. GAS368]|jgi:xanthine permease XanP|uniref:uracil-xanthine permease family protein n=1 Tax=Opitutus sp. GAS368 TaxID=1882749 RepID=UPI00087A0253|nr:solute carrier family 23 protein [Opitutus sp. GAS368]SDS62827.1 nucleobase:cation symporter-2, NCS2 family/xanthine permease XanP [Opitutus sp. GAS368]